MTKSESAFLISNTATIVRPFRRLATNQWRYYKVLGRGTRRVVNRAATALRQSANTLMRSRSYLGAQYRRLRTKLGAPKAITAMAHRLARLVYRMLKYGQAYVDQGTQYYEERFRQQQIQLLRKRAAKLGLQVAEIHA